MYNVDPSPEELQEWLSTAARRNAILPARIEVRGHYITVVCGNAICQEIFNRKLLPNRNDPILICPSCQQRIYIPIKW